MRVRFYTGAIKDRLCITDFNKKQNLAERKVKKHIKSIIPRHRKYMLLPGICFYRYRFLGDLFFISFLSIGVLLPGMMHCSHAPVKLPCISG